MSNTINYVTNLDISYLVQYIRDRIPRSVHLRLTPFEIKLLVVRIMDYDGVLDPRDSKILRTPVLGKAYVASNGDIEKAFERVAVDALPGASLFRLF